MCVDEFEHVDQTAFELEPWQREIIEAANQPWIDAEAFAREFMRLNHQRRRRGEGMR